MIVDNSLSSIASQLTKIYFNEEWWHKVRMPLSQAYNYHYERLVNGNIKVVTSLHGIVLGYYEKYIDKDTCYLWNVWVHREFRNSWVFQSLYNLFMSELPESVTSIIGEKQKLHGKLMKTMVRR